MATLITTSITSCGDDASPPPTISYGQFNHEKTMRHKMIDAPNPKEKIYEICLEGHLEARWANWFDGLVITLDEKGNTLLSGPVADQAALHGLLKKVRDLGIPLISVNSVGADPE